MPPASLVCGFTGSTGLTGVTGITGVTGVTGVTGPPPEPLESPDAPPLPLSLNLLIGTHCLVFLSSTYPRGHFLTFLPLNIGILYI